MMSETKRHIPRRGQDKGDAMSGRGSRSEYNIPFPHFRELESHRPRFGEVCRVSLCG